MNRLLLVMSLALATALTVLAPSAQADPQVVTYETIAAGSNFEFVVDGQPALIQLAAGRSTRTTSPETTTEVSTRAYATFQQYNPETGEVISWSCDMPVDNDSFAVDAGWTAELHTVLVCGDGVGDPFSATVDLVVEGNGPVSTYHTYFSDRAVERLGEARGSVTANGTTYNLVSEQANITKYSTVDPVSTDRWFISGESSGFYREDVDGLACIGITDIYGVRESVATNVFAAVTLDNSGTYHFYARGTIGYTIFGGDGAYYQGTTSVRIRESADLVLDESGSAHVPISFPITLTTADGSASATFVIDGLIGVVEGNHIAFGLVGARCA
jgi:hypothetical protein